MAELFRFSQPDEKLKFGRAIMTVEQFAAEYNNGSLEDVYDIIEVLQKKGKITKYEEQMTKEEKIIDKASKEYESQVLAENLNAQEQNLQMAKKADNYAGSQIHKKVELPFPNQLLAEQAEVSIANKYNLDTEVKIKQGVVFLVLHDVYDRDLVNIARQYNTDRAIETGLNMVSNGVDKMSSVIDYTASKIAAPTFQIAAKCGVGILKSLFKVASKTGATLITAGSEGIKQTYDEVSRDPDIARAKAELISAKDAASRKLATYNGVGGLGGIKIVDED